MSFSDYWEVEILDHLFMKGAYGPLANLYIGLSTADPLDDWSGIAEPVGGSYARVSTAGADYNAAAAGSIDNANAITFVASTGAWGLCGWVCIFDALVAGNGLASGALTLAKNVNNGDTARFAAGNLTCTLD